MSCMRLTTSLTCTRAPGEAVSSAGRKETNTHDDGHVFDLCEGAGKGRPLSREKTHSHDGGQFIDMYEDSKKSYTLGAEETNSHDGR